MNFEKKDMHPSYGMLSFSRTAGTGKRNLFGSSIKHGNTIVMKLSHARLERGLNQDWCYPKGLIAEVEMSGSQFAELITTMNQSEGVPCTIRWLNGEDIERPPIEDKAELHRKEFAEHQNDILNLMKETLDLTTELFDKKTLNKADKELIKSKLKKLSQEVGVNSDYQVSQFDEQMSKTITEAKIEIENFIQNRMIAIANEALVNNMDKLIEKTPENPVELMDNNEEE